MNRTIFQRTAFLCLVWLVLAVGLMGMSHSRQACAQHIAGADVLAAFYGDYPVRIMGQVGGPYEPTGSPVTGTTTGVVSFSVDGTVTLGPSEPGVIAVPPGEVIPGVDPEDIIYGAAVIQNPLYVFIGTPTASEVGDFGLHSMLRFGLPDEPNELTYSGCNSGAGVFSCIPEFFRSVTVSDRSVNLIYFTLQASGMPASLTITGRLVDRHIAEAAAANLFSVPVESPVLGTLNDPFVCDAGTTFELIVANGRIQGQILGSGVSAAGLAPQMAIFEATIESTDSAIPVEDGLPELQRATLSPIYPNPFHPRAAFTLTLAQAQRVRIAVYDLLGRPVALLHDDLLAPTRHTFTLDGHTLPAGVYVVRAVGDYFTASRTAVLLR